MVSMVATKVPENMPSVFKTQKVLENHPGHMKQQESKNEENQIQNEVEVLSQNDDE
jgi:hypothetical protein